jgi:HemY protein
MIRVVFYLVIVGLVAFGAVWFAEHPGDVAITWQGRRIETSVMVLVVAVVALAAAAMIAWSLVRAAVRAPSAFARHLAHRRGVRGYHAVSRGLIAVGSGDVGAAKRYAEEADRLIPGEPLTLLLAAQSAQLAGDRAGAAGRFEAMAGRDDTRLLGLHGLFIEARRRNDPAAALLYAEEAAKEGAAPGWAGQAVLEFRCVAGDWAGALERLDRNYTGGLVDKPAYRRQRAVLLTAQALALEDGDRERARALGLEAVKLAPDLVPAAALAGRLLGEAGELRKAARILEAAWRVNPHPDLADGYADLRPGSSARERLARVEALTAKTPGALEAALAVARAALAAQEFAIARAALAPFGTAPTRRVAALMAALEMGQGDEGRAREWMARALNARRDPAWTADGFISDRWLPVSPVSGRLDAFEWKDPLAGEDHAMIEAGERAALEGSRALAPMERAPHETSQVGQTRVALGDGAGGSSRDSHATIVTPSPEERGERTESAAPPPSRSQESQSPGPRSRRERGATAVPLAPAVIPLLHAPDDPGPEPEAAIEPEPEPTAEAPPDNWSRIRALFKP